MPDVSTFKILTPWDEVKLPEYRLFALGKWRCRKTPPHVNLSGGYWFPVPVARAGFMLQKKVHGDWKTWMSLTPMELQSHQPHIANAHGNVVVAGLGMGMYLFNIIQKPEVKKVLVCEIDPEIVTMFERITEWEKWPNADKITIRTCDARKLQLERGADFVVDYLYVDIWEKLGEQTAHIEVQNMVTNIHPKTVGYWGQELDFAAFLGQNKLPLNKETSVEHWQLFGETSGVPFACDWDLYPRFACAATMFRVADSPGLSDHEKQQIYMQAMYVLGALDGLGTRNAESRRAAEANRPASPEASVLEQARLDRVDS